VPHLSKKVGFVSSHKYVVSRLAGKNFLDTIIVTFPVWPSAPKDSPSPLALRYLWILMVNLKYNVCVLFKLICHRAFNGIMTRIMWSWYTSLISPLLVRNTFNF
jgi:hypothetical protein